MYLYSRADNNIILFSWHYELWILIKRSFYLINEYYMKVFVELNDFINFNSILFFVNIQHYSACDQLCHHTCIPLHLISLCFKPVV